MLIIINAIVLSGLNLCHEPDRHRHHDLQEDARLHGDARVDFECHGQGIITFNFIRINIRTIYCLYIYLYIIIRSFGRPPSLAFSQRQPFRR
jgi:hypothetical protein